MIDVRGAFSFLQIISFADRFLAVIDDALSSSKTLVRESNPLKIVPLPHLIAVKQYAGGHKSKADSVELLIRDPRVDLESVKKLCRRYRLRGLDKLIAEAEL